MAQPTVAEYFKYANLQMAAEAFLVDGFGKPYLVAKDYIDALITGNKHASRFTDINPAIQ